MEGEVPNGELTFHQDGCYAERPAKRTLLFGLEIPTTGGNTKFCSTARAFAALPASQRERLLEYDVHFVHDRWSGQNADVHTGPQYTHPLVIAHPTTGVPLLFCNGFMADAIVGLPRAESDARIAELRAEMERPEDIYEHVWRVGDLVAWANLLTQHARTDWDPAERRALRRMQTVGSKPIAYRDTAGLVRR